jgi:signal transduction histidine kinase
VSALIVSWSSMTIPRSWDSFPNYSPNKGSRSIRSPTITQALESLDRNEYAIVLTDLSLPDGNGIDLINRVQEKDPLAVPILITGFGTMESAIDAIHAKVYDFIPKPFDIGHLVSTLRKGAEKRRLEIENKRLLDQLQTERNLLKARVDEATRDLQRKLREHETLNNEVTILFEIMRDIRGDLRMSESLTRLAEYLGRALEFDSFFWVVSDISDQLISYRDWSGAHSRQYSLRDLAPSQLEDLRNLVISNEDFSNKNQSIRNWIGANLESDTDQGRVIVAPFKTSTDLFGIVGLVRTVPFENENQRLLSLATAQLVTVWEENAVIQRGSQMASIGELTAEVAHDLRNGLSAFRHIAEHFFAEIDPGDPKNAEYKEVFLQNLERTDDLVRDLLTLGRPDEDPSQTVNVQHLLDRVLTISGKTLERHRIEVDIDIPEENLVVMGSVKEFSEGLINILMNSIQAMKDGGRLRILASTSDRKREGSEDSQCRYVRITISDTGIGIPPENLKRVFGRYFTTKPKGTGLGLSLLQKVVRKYLGWVEIESEVGSGTTVSVFLPQI